MDFDVAGPFELKRHTHNRIVTKRSAAALREEAEDWEPGLSNACGCYEFALQAGRGAIPFYVGQACKRSLVKEAMNPANLGKYNEILGDRRSGRPIIFLLPMRTPGGKFRKRKKGNGRLAAVDFLERWLIAAALERNTDLANNRETKFLRRIHVNGIFNAKRGESNDASKRLGSVLWKY